MEHTTLHSAYLHKIIGDDGATAGTSNIKQDEENETEISVSAKIAARVKELEAQVSQLKNGTKRLEQEKMADSKKYKEAMTKSAQYKSKMDGFKVKLDEASGTIAHLQYQLETTNRMLRNSEIELMNSQTRYADLSNEYEDAQKHHDRRVAKCDLLAKDNEELRRQIAQLSNAQDSIHEEEFYIREFDKMGMEINSWVAKETSNMSKESLSSSSKERILSFIKQYGMHGSVSAIKSLVSANSIWNSNRRDRITLIRHILAIFLFDNVFDRFSFGLEREMSEYFKRIEKDIWDKGSYIEIEKSLTI
jgi:chromosome segregation ATPase